MSTTAMTPAGNGNRALAPIDRLKNMLSAESVQQQFRNALGDAAPLFAASLIDVYGGDRYLQECQPSAVVREALKAATLRLPINRNLGFAYIVAYKGDPQMQMGYRGYIQLAQRTGQYRYINAGPVFEGETVKEDRLSGEVAIGGTPTSDKAIGFFAYIETVTGFKKAIYWPIEKVKAHAERYSASLQGRRRERSPWVTHFDEMATKTVLRHILSRYGIMSVELQRALDEDIKGSIMDMPEDAPEQHRAPKPTADLGALVGMDDAEPDADAPDAEFEPSAPEDEPLPPEEEPPKRTHRTNSPQADLV